MHWDPQGGGTEIPSPVDNALEQLWKQHVQELGITPTQIHRPPRKRRYWWVSQSRTGQQEVAGGYMWSPKTAAEGNRFFSYEFMKECAPGDIVFSFIDTAISTIGMVTGFCYESDKPDEFHAAGRAWITEGWRVPVNFRPTAQAMRPADNMETLGPLLPTKYSPIQTTGRGNQAYLSPVPENLAQAILSLVGETPESVSTSVPATNQADLADVTREDREQYELQRIDQDTSITETERTSLRKSRNGQQLFRQRVSEREPCCRVTGISNDEYRIASHIKPWSHSNNQERLDGNNGLLLAPHIDHLFDKGLISFGDDGTLLISPAADIKSLRQMAVPVDESFNAGNFSEQQRVYLEYHRLEVFRRAAS